MRNADERNSDPDANGRDESQRTSYANDGPYASIVTLTSMRFLWSWPVLFGRRVVLGCGCCEAVRSKGLDPVVGEWAKSIVASGELDAAIAEVVVFDADLRS